MALEDAHRHGPARDVLLLGRRALGRPSAFGIELAELSQLAGDWEGAAREWAAALTDAPVQLPNAASALAEAPDAQRERIARLLTEGTPSPPPRPPSRARATPTWRPRGEGRPPGRAPTRRALSSRQAIGSPRAPCSNGSRRTRMRLLTPNGWRSAPWSRP